MPNIEGIICPPETGKATEIMRLTEAATERYNLQRIGVAAFTNAAIETIKKRIATKIDIELDNIRSILNHAFHLACMSGVQTYDSDKKQWIPEFCEAYSHWDLSGSSDQPKELFNQWRSMKNILKNFRVYRRWDKGVLSLYLVRQIWAL